jgi:hypothetical protein
LSLPFENLLFFLLFEKKICFFRWGTTDRTVGDSSTAITNNTVPYVRRRSAAGVNEPTSSPSSTTTTSTVVSVTTSLPSVTSTPTTNVIVTSPNTLDDSTGGKRRSNVPPSRDEEAEAQRKHRSAQARRERRSTQSVTVEDIKAAEQQIKNQPNNSEMSTSVTIPQPITNIVETTSNVTLSNNKIGAPSTPSLPAEHDIETERLQRVIEEKKEKARRLSGGNEVKLVYIYIFNLDYSFIYSCLLVSVCVFFLICLFVQLTMIIHRQNLLIIKLQG